MELFKKLRVVTMISLGVALMWCDNRWKYGPVSKGVRNEPLTFVLRNNRFRQKSLDYDVYRLYFKFTWNQAEMDKYQEIL